MPTDRMRKLFLLAFLLAPGAAVPGCGGGARQGSSSPAALPGREHTFFKVRVDAPPGASLSGRLLIFVKRGEGDAKVDARQFKPGESWVAAREVRNLVPGVTIEIDADQQAYPRPFSAMPAGRYEAQAVLDVDHSYNYRGRSPEDWVSGVTALKGLTSGGGTEPMLILDRRSGEDKVRLTRRLKNVVEAKMVGAQLVEFVSPMLSRFWGHPVSMRAWIILPPGYSDRAAETYPTVYWTHGFGGGLDSCLSTGLLLRERMKSGKMPPMIWVMLEQATAQGTHEFADSVNAGPWGTALTTELIPYLEGRYRMDARVSGRLLQGHSSGGWATLQLQVNFPTIFGGTWSTSPDSSDFHDFSGVDLYAADVNLYRRQDGSAVPIMREDGKVTATLEEFGKLEAVTGEYGGQLSSFEWVFSPKGPDGAPMPMFDRETGKVDPAVVGYWREHYDLSHIAEAQWRERGADLRGKIHVAVGTEDTFYLDGASRRFEAVLGRLGAEPHYTYLPGRSHFDLYRMGDDDWGLLNQIGAEMYAVARPGVDWRRK